MGNILFNNEIKTYLFTPSGIQLQENKDATDIPNFRGKLTVSPDLHRLVWQATEGIAIADFDNETGKIMWVDSSDKSFRKQLEINHLKFEAQLKDTFTKSGVDYTTILTHEGYIKPLMTLFKKR